MPTPPRDPSCVFCKIVAGEIPCHCVYEDADTLAFLDIFPLADGHLVVIPKAHYTHLHELPADLAGRVCAVLPQLGQRLIRAVGAQGYNLLQNNHAVAGQVVPHVHFHLIPRREGDALGYRWPAGKLDPARAKDLLAALAS